MKVIHLSYSDTGGAGRAAYRIHCALRDNGIKSLMQVIHSTSGDNTVESVTGNIKGKIIQKARELTGKLISSSSSVENSIIHSPAVLPSGLPFILNNSDADVIHLHWIGREMLSIKDISKIKKPVVWTFHDMWAFCGAEHISYDNRYKEGYTSENRLPYANGFDLNFWTWRRKNKYWKNPIEIVTPSHWMAECVKKSSLMSEWPVRVIPNPIDTKKWLPVEKNIARQILGVPIDCQLIAFGSYGENQAYHKGHDLLKSALNHLKNEFFDLKVIVIGQNAPVVPVDMVFPTIYGGFLYDDISLRLLYSAVDAIIVPSRIESFSQMASEANTCGTPVIAFNVCGLRDIVDNLSTGYLANPYDAEDLAKGVRWVLSDASRLESLGKNARKNSVELFDKDVVSKKYIDLYRYVLSK